MAPMVRHCPVSAESQAGFEPDLASGQLRPHPIAAYSPNTPWLSVRDEKGTRIADGVDLDGAGTSAATPQVAAAAALWLQKHR